GHVALIRDAHIAADTAVLVDNRFLDHAAVADADVRQAALTVRQALQISLVAIGADQHRIAQHDIATDTTADADGAAFQVRSLLHDAAIADEALLDRGGADARRR